MADLREPAHRVSPRAPRLWRVEAAIGALLTLAVALAVCLLWVPAPWRWWVLGVLSVLEIAGVALSPAWRYRTHRWEVSEQAVYTQTGWYARERRIAPMSRVQTVEMSQGVIERAVGLATVTVTTASSAAALKIEGLDRDVAVALVEELTRRAEDLAGDAT